MKHDWQARVQHALRCIRAARDQSTERLVRHQTALARHVRLRPFAIDEVDRIAGVDVHYAKGGACAAVTCLRADTLEVLETAYAVGLPLLDYQHGMLGFRELPLIFEAAQRLTTAPDLCFYDGNGVLHPRGFGAASQFGLLLKVPTIGVSKNVRDYQPFPELKRGERRVIESRRGALLVTRDDTNPVCVSPGHAIDLDCALDASLRYAAYRIPEPTRLADQFARAHG